MKPPEPRHQTQLRLTTSQDGITVKIPKRVVETTLSVLIILLLLAMTTILAQNHQNAVNQSIQAAAALLEIILTLRKAK